MRLTFSDCVEVSHLNIKGFVIGEALHSTDACQVVVVANGKSPGMSFGSGACQIVGTGFHAYATELQRKYLSQFPRGLRWVDDKD